MEATEGSETSDFKIQTPGKYPEEYLPHLQHGESLKTMRYTLIYYLIQNCLPLEVKRFYCFIFSYCPLQTCLHASPLLIFRRTDVIKFTKFLILLL
jgi:hypothetical protein